MIVVDASALIAILFNEPEREAFQSRLDSAGAMAISAVNLWEVLVRTRKVLGEDGVARLERLLRTYGLEIAPIDETEARRADAAHTQFGRGTPAGLNLGDCFAYALAKSRGAPLLYKGDDFARTDIVAA